jgi:hypothetical protein
MIQVGNHYHTNEGKLVHIISGSRAGSSGAIFTGSNGVWYDENGRTTRGKQLDLDLETKGVGVRTNKLTTNERELFQCLKEVIEDLELRADVHETLTGEERVVNMSDGRYQKAKRLLAEYGERG